VSDLTRAKPGQRKRRDYRLERLARALHRDTRTIRRWLDERLALRPILRARKVNGQWRLDYPKSEKGFRAYVSEVQKAVAPFTNAPFSSDSERSRRDRLSRERSKTDPIFDDYFGLGNSEIEADGEILKRAMILKRLRVSADLEGQELEWFHLSEIEWNSIIERLVIDARRCAKLKGCSVRQSLDHIKAELRNPEKVERTEFFWPEERDWKKAERQINESWLRETLSRAAFGLVSIGKKLSEITGQSLAPLLFRNREHERVYRNYQARQQEIAKAKDGGYCLFNGYGELTSKVRPPNYRRPLHGRPDPEFGEPGISRAEFFQRYTKEDIKAAKAAAITADASKLNQDDDGLDSDDLAGMSELDSHLRRPSRDSLSQPIDQVWARRHRERLRIDRREIEEFRRKHQDAPVEQRRAVEEALQNPFHDEHKKGQYSFKKSR